MNAYNHPAIWLSGRYRFIAEKLLDVLKWFVLKWFDNEDSKRL